MAEQEASLGDFGLELLPSVHLAHICITECESLLIDVFLNVIQQFGNMLRNAFTGYGSLLSGVPACNFKCAFSKVTRPHCYTHRHSLELPFGELEARTESVPVVNLHADVCLFEFSLDFIHLRDYGLVVLVSFVNRHHNHLDRSQGRRQHESVVIAVSHYERTHKTG